VFHSRTNTDSSVNFDKELLSSNILGITNMDELLTIERKITSIKQNEIRRNGLKGDFDYDHLKKIHKELFKDIYNWAGEDRYDMGYGGVFRKGKSEFTLGSGLPVVAKALFKALEDENYFKNLAQKDIIKSLASFLHGLNVLHPFREGNGRTQRLFIEELAKNAGYTLNLSNVNQHTMIQASILGFKNIKGYELILEKHLNKTPIKIPHKIKSTLDNKSKNTSVRSRYKRR